MNLYKVTKISDLNPNLFKEIFVLAKSEISEEIDRAILTDPHFNNWGYSVEIELCKDKEIISQYFTQEYINIYNQYKPLEDKLYDIRSVLNSLNIPIPDIE